MVTIFVFVVRIFVLVVAILLFVVAIFVSEGTIATDFRENTIHYHIRILHENRNIRFEWYAETYTSIVIIKKKMREEINFHSHVFIQT